MSETVKPSGLCTAERGGGSAGVQVVRNRRNEEPLQPPEAMAMPMSGLLPRAMCGSMALLC